MASILLTIYFCNYREIYWEIEKVEYEEPARFERFQSIILQLFWAATMLLVFWVLFW